MSMTIEEGNKTIAEFMGVKIGVDQYSWRIGCTEPLKESHLAYHKEWDWLMPVVEKMGKIGYSFTIDPWEIELIEYLSGKEDTILKHQINNEETKINNWWYAVIQFIQWYTTQSNTNASEGGK